MLVSAEEMLKKAKAGKYAVGQFNITTWSGQNPFFSQHRSAIHRLSLVYLREPENICVDTKRL